MLRMRALDVERLDILELLKRLLRNHHSVPRGDWCISC